MRSVWAEIDLDALADNIKNIKSCIKNNAKWCAVVKANAYGHGVIPVAKKCVEMGASYLAVAVLEEAIELREAGFTTPILILGGTAIEDSSMIVKYDITQAVFTHLQVETISKEALLQGKTAKVHLKVDTGMGRIGIRPKEAGSFAKEISQMPGVELEGVFSHFALADGKNKTFAKKQLKAFKQAIKLIENENIEIKLKHIANSAAILDMPETHFDMVRAGIVLYGLWPSDEVNHTIELKQIMKVCAKIEYIKKMRKGEPISYGCTFVVDRESRIGTLPLGYADGYTRLFTEKAQVEYKGKRAKVVGRICMDQCMVDLTGIPEIKECDTVVLFGSETLTTDEVAGWIGTINYELPCMMSSRIPRVYKSTK